MMKCTQSQPYLQLECHQVARPFVADLEVHQRHQDEAVGP